MFFSVLGCSGWFWLILILLIFGLVYFVVRVGVFLVRGWFVFVVVGVVFLVGDFGCWF